MGSCMNKSLKDAAERQPSLTLLQGGKMGKMGQAPSAKNGLFFTFDLSETGYVANDVMIAVIADISKSAPPVYAYLDHSLQWKVREETTDPLTPAMVITLDKLGSVVSPTLPLADCAGGRVYFSFGEKTLLDIQQFPNSGPVPDKNNEVVYDKFEFFGGLQMDSQTQTPLSNINMTQVDFYGLSFTLTAVDVNTQTEKSIGFQATRAEVLAAFDAIPDMGDGVVVGNPGFMKHLVFSNSSSNLTQILAPKNASPEALDASAALCNQTSHFFNEYIQKHCFKPGRTFTCYSKLYPDDKKVYYGVVDSSGEKLNIFTDASHTTAYRSNVDGEPLELHRPASNESPPQPDFANGFSAWHQVTKDPVDWGFIIEGNTQGPLGTTAAYWAEDDVAMAILVSICRGVMHLDSADDWLNTTNFYQGAPSGADAKEFPIFYYSKVMHDLAVDKKAYALSYDDVFGSDPTLYVKDSDTLQANVAVKFHGKIDTIVSK